MALSCFGLDNGTHFAISATVRLSRDLHRETVESKKLICLKEKITLTSESVQKQHEVSAVKLAVMEDRFRDHYIQQDTRASSCQVDVYRELYR